MADGRPPWWRRPRKLRRQLALTLVFVAFVSVATVGTINFYAASRLLDDGTKESLVGIGESRARRIEDGATRLVDRVGALAADLGVVRALSDLSDGFEALGDEELTAAQNAELDDFYRIQLIEPLEEADLGSFTTADVSPGSDEGRWLQYHWTMPLADDPEARAAVVDAGDGTAYSDAHAAHHGFLSTLATAPGASDLLLVTSDGDVVYTTNKAVDLGTDLAEGPLSDSNLATTVLGDLTRVRLGEGVIADFALYIPAGARPTMFVAAAVRDDTEVIGALVVQIPVDALNAITGADGAWDEVGLRGGENYVVGGDTLLRSESRPWIEDPGGYLGKTDDELARLIELFGSPVGLQPVATDPVSEALDGRVFEGNARNYLGQRTFSHATPIDVSGVDWVVVTDVPRSEAREPLVDFALELGLVLLLVLPAAAVGGVLLANRLTRPIPPVVEAAEAIAAGERDPQIPDLGADEFGDLARRLRGMAKELGRQESEIVDEYEQTRELLLTVLPPRLVDSDGNVTGSGETTDEATVVAVWLELQDDDPDSDTVLELLSTASTVAESIAADLGMERIRRAADHSLFLSGIGSESDGVEDAIRFTRSLVDEVTQLAITEQIRLDVHAGLSTGRVATGMLERGNLSFAAWGSPVRRALAIGALNTDDTVVLDRTTAERAQAMGFATEPAGERVSLDGEPIQVYVLD